MVIVSRFELLIRTTIEKVANVRFGSKTDVSLLVDAPGCYQPTSDRSGGALTL